MQRVLILQKLIVIIRIVNGNTFSVLLFNQNNLDWFFSFAHSSIKVDKIQSAFQLNLDFVEKFLSIQGT